MFLSSRCSFRADVPFEPMFLSNRCSFRTDVPFKLMFLSTTSWWMWFFHSAESFFCTSHLSVPWRWHTSSTQHDCPHAWMVHSNWKATNTILSVASHEVKCICGQKLVNCTKTENQQETICRHSLFTLKYIMSNCTPNLWMVKTNPSLPPGWMKLVAGTLQIGEDGAIGGNLFETVQPLTKGCLQCSMVRIMTRNLTYKSCCAVPSCRSK